MNSSAQSIVITVKGLVQGVGFRPFIYRIAIRNQLVGWVQNTNESVLIKVQGSKKCIHSFLESLKKEAPPASYIEQISYKNAEADSSNTFKIHESYDISDKITEISPDIAVCEDCLEDIKKEGNRFFYPFINCTNCGPRFTIINDLPYDRNKTSMNTFPMCADCRVEYENITDRRFHAQPIACNSCGPNYKLLSDQVGSVPDAKEMIEWIANLLDNGKVIAIKGLGGMHLACDAFNENAVMRLRRIKYREGKPFALMFRDMASVRKYVLVNKTEESALLSWRSPIVLLDLKRHDDNLPNLSKEINSGLSRLGVMLPYMPLHYLLFDQLCTSAVVLTSGNFSNEPIIIDNDNAIEKFLPIVDEVILHDRDIRNRADDSVVIVINRKERVIRRSRGYAPTAMRSSFNLNGIIAFGAELSNCFCVGQGQKAILSQYIGDLQGYETTLFYEEALDKFIRLFRVKPELLVTDLHPDYYSNKYAKEFKKRIDPDSSIMIKLIGVQHHHAHIASCMAEHGLDEQVIGVSFDGTGYGTDGNIWGAEFMLCDLIDFSRITHFDYVPLPGGDRATEEPWRIAVSYLFRTFGKDFMNLNLPLLKKISREKIDDLILMIDKKINCPLVSSAGRMFDAISAILDLCLFASFPAEGPMRLESIMAGRCNEKYTYIYSGTLKFEEMIKGVVLDLNSGIDLSVISTKFHNTMIAIICETAKDISKSTGIRKIVLSGGVFQNKYLLSGVENQLKKDNFEVYSHQLIPTNDGGIALGQAIIAAKRRASLCV
jgi:hydrogenase maturation protein HypF